MQLAVFGVNERLGLNAEVTMRSGRLSLRMPPAPPAPQALQAAFLLDTVGAMLTGLAVQHPEFIRVTDRGTTGQG